MTEEVQKLLAKHGLAHHASVVDRFLMPCISFDMLRVDDAGAGMSRLGGNPKLDVDFVWPNRQERPLEVVAQIDLGETAPFDSLRKLPVDGLLTFFYDMEEQPWGFDPKDSTGFKVHYTPAGVPVSQHSAPDSEFRLPERSLEFRSSFSVPSFGTRDYDRLGELTRFSDSETDRFADFRSDLALLNSGYQRKYWGGKHRLLGYSDNIQGDMQLEAELVTNGLYCGDPSGYHDPRAKALESNADDWILLLQIDSDENVDLMWGDVGSIYFWIRRDDLARQHFDNVWMALQCS